MSDAGRQKPVTMEELFKQQQTQLEAQLSQLQMQQEQLQMLQSQTSRLTIILTMGSLELPSYDGTTDPDDHIDRYEAMTSMEGWDDAEKKGCFHRTLTKTANSWLVHNVATIIAGTWDDLKTAFLDFFRSPTYRQDRYAAAVHRSQGSQELVREYIMDISHLWYRYDPQPLQSSIIAYIIGGLRADIASRFIGRKFDSIPQVMRAAIEVEAHIRKRESYSPTGGR